MPLGKVIMDYTPIAGFSFALLVISLEEWSKDFLLSDAGSTVRSVCNTD